jgi:hypothetical protein
MNYEDPDAPLESELRGLPLREPGRALDVRVNRVFARQRFRRPQWTVFARLAMAACLLLGVGYGLINIAHRPTPPVKFSMTKPRPIRLERDTSTLYDEVVIVRNDDAYQQYRRRTIREIWYVDPATHSQIEMTIPVDQIFIRKMEAF